MKGEHTGKLSTHQGCPSKAGETGPSAAWQTAACVSVEMSLFITGVSAGRIGELAELAQMTSKGCGHLKKESGCGHLKKESGCGHLKKEPRWQVE